MAVRQIINKENAGGVWGEGGEPPEVWCGDQETEIKLPSMLRDNVYAVKSVLP